ncbi:hypothetical protein LCGC14_0722800 [marine sediment metagenome]|uniref:HNH nuclease domain-containing protein n=1 Tax=marine sediment metagenome TaxID=412755 RepID=A0A0F9SX64_9ZZZZ
MAHMRSFAPARRCESCTTLFRPRKDAIAKGRGRFCSQGCVGLSQAKPVVNVSRVLHLYVEEGKGIRQVAAEVEAGWKQVQRLLKRHGVLRPGGRYAPSSYSAKLYRQAAAKKLGRVLRRGELVHHIDGDHANMTEKNLFVTNRSGHQLLHRQLERMALRLVRNGLIQWQDDSYTFSSEMERQLKHV